MGACWVKNPSVEICSLPVPLQGVLQGGQTIVLPYSQAELLAACPSIDAAFLVGDLPDYTGPTQEDEFGLSDPLLVASLSVQQNITSSGTHTMLTVAGAPSTGITAGTEQTDVRFNLERTQTWATGALPTQRFFRIDAPTMAFAGASTVTNAATVYVADSPQAGTNATITNSYAVWVDAGATRLDGAVTCNSTVYFGGALSADATNASGSPGAATINKPAGKVAIAIGQSSVVVTNSLVTTSSIVIPVLQTVDATLTSIVNCTVASGAFTIRGNATATAAATVAFLVIN